MHTEDRRFRHRSEIRRRPSLRLKEYDYSQEGAYFVTVCTRHRECYFGPAVDSLMRFNDAGKMVHSAWLEMVERFPGVALDKFVVMPNHVHGIVIIQAASHHRDESCPHPSSKTPVSKGRLSGTATGSLGRVIQAYKSITTNRYIQGVRVHQWEPFPGKLWQRDYYDHIIRSEEGLQRIRQYILENPANWEFDEENPNKRL